MTIPEEISAILDGARRREVDELAELGPTVYQELREVARRQLRRMRPGKTLDTTALVHEAYLKLADQETARWQDHVHFVSVAAVAMRHLLVDYARRRQALKRGGDAVRITLDGQPLGATDKSLELLAVNEALETLAERSPRLGRVVDLRFFGGLSVEETATAMGTSERTVKRDWRKARAVLYGMLTGDSAGS